MWNPIWFVLLAACALRTSEAVKFKILHFNDFHSRIEADGEWHGYCHDYELKEGKCTGGLARMKTFIEWEKEKEEPVLVLNAGDDFIGTLWDHHYKGKAAAHFMNQLGIDVVTLGNHDFDYGPDVLVEYVKHLEFPVLSANLEANGHELGDYVKPYVIKEINGVKVGICGVTTQGTQDYSNPSPVKFKSTHDGAQSCAEELTKKNVGIIILLSHSGFNADRFHAKLVPHIDMVVGGHSHAFLWTSSWGEPPAITRSGGYPVKDHVWGDYPTWESSEIHDGKRIPVVQAGWATRYIGKAVVEFDDEGHLTSFEGQPFLLGDSPSDSPVPENKAMKKDIER
ncbi:hypothetical protein BSKO_10296 [Bryopsis sp. KO-2023]|nr:hypothetical protein BSKO_10296 [Bryopsis sp. KO-2023]